MNNQLKSAVSTHPCSLGKDTQIFHAGTYQKNGEIYSTGGRVLNATSSSDNLLDARNKSIDNLKKINWLEGFFRKDIGWRSIKKSKI